MKSNIQTVFVCFWKLHNSFVVFLEIAYFIFGRVHDFEIQGEFSVEITRSDPMDPIKPKTLHMPAFCPLFYRIPLLWYSYQPFSRITHLCISKDTNLNFIHILQSRFFFIFFSSVGGTFQENSWIFVSQSWVHYGFPPIWFPHNLIIRKIIANFPLFFQYFNVLLFAYGISLLYMFFLCFFLIFLLTAKKLSATLLFCLVAAFLSTPDSILLHMLIKFNVCMFK